ncbi:hypothetical protein KZZ52_42245 [Dactylosporangium sp. AC04546]|nr:hypothetical protein [Dactylosporangium sp. AC04546]WVK80540.1 hypothetical protein KZZ52_42245 [Dactylosporangium sp. AC04546]
MTKRPGYSRASRGLESFMDGSIPTHRFLGDVIEAASAANVVVTQR